MTGSPLDIFLAGPPGLEPLLLDEARDHGFAGAEAVPGGVLVRGGWPEIWRANLVLRGAGRVLVRFGAFYAVHLAQLDKRARRLPWAAALAPGTAVKVDATCQKSRIWHAGAAAERIERAAAAALGPPREGTVPVRILVRIVEDRCTVSLDTSGEPLHRRGTKLDVGRAPMRETLAALFLRACGQRDGEPVVDPMCGSGTFVIEAAEASLGLAPGRSRAFAFQGFPGFDRAEWERLRAAVPPRPGSARFFGFDRDAGAIETSRANAGRAGLAEVAVFRQQPIGALQPPAELAGSTGLVIVNPPYGERIGDRGALFALHGTLGRVLRERFSGWRVGLVTSEPALAQATGLPFADQGPPVPHGPLRVRLYRTDRLP